MEVATPQQGNNMIKIIIFALITVNSLSVFSDDQERGHNVKFNPNSTNPLVELESNKIDSYTFSLDIDEAELLLQSKDSSTKYRGDRSKINCKNIDNFQSDIAQLCGGIK